MKTVKSAATKLHKEEGIMAKTNLEEMAVSVLFTTLLNGLSDFWYGQSYYQSSRLNMYRFL